MGLDLGCHSFVHALDTDTTSQIMHGDGQHEYDHECGEHPAGQKVQKRHAEDVEADVFAELWVVLAEVDAVGEQQPVAPL